MSIDSTYKNRLDINLNSKPLQSTLSHSNHLPITRHSLKSPSRERYRQEHSQTRSRTMSSSTDPNSDTITELTSTFSNKHDDKHDKRYSEVKPAIERHDLTAVERRNSTPQLHLSALFSHTFRNQKHHKVNSKDETNATNLTGNNVNASASSSSNHFADTMTTKGDPPFTLKSSISPMNDSRLISSNSNERLLLSQNEDSASSASFIIEENSSEPRSAELFIIESHTPICVSESYHQDFFEYFHTNYYGEFHHEGPFIASLRCITRKTSIGDICVARGIIRTAFRNCNVSDIVNGTNENNILQMLFNKGNLPSIHSYGTIGDPKANEKIYLFDKTNDERFHCKIGVIYQHVNQTNEYDIFSNDNLSKEMVDFLEILADRVRLKGFPKYRGDLDTKDDLHGQYSYYTVYDNHEIMFNVAPLVPSTKANGQCIERKGLVGNSFVCIVFQDSGAIFSPDFISGKVTQIYITVQPIIHENETYYKIGIWRRNDITSIIDPPGGTYKNDSAFLSYFLTLLLNSVNVAIESPSLRLRVFEQRQRIKYEELKKLCHVFSLGPIPDFISDIDNNMNYPIDMRSHPRSESFASNTTGFTNDGANPNPGRISPVSSKKKGFSRKIFNVFSSRSGSISSSVVPSNNVNNESSSSTPQTPSISDTYTTLARASVPLIKETMKPTRSIKTTQAPIPPTRPSNSSQILHTISIQPPTPSAITSNPINSDNLTQNNLLNKTVFDITPRNRSNSSPEDTVNSTKSQPLSVPTIDEEHSANSYDDDDEEEESEDESSEDDKPSNRPLRLS